MRIEIVLERNSLLQRLESGSGGEAQLLAANVDLAFLVMGLPEDFNIARLERYLALTRDGNVEPVVVLTKRDLVQKPENFCEQARLISGDAEVLLVSNHTGEGIAAVKARLGSGQTAVILGSSGVGKSTLVNSLAGESIQATQATQEGGKGRHTTTGRSIIRLGTGALLLDTPGLREVGLWIEGDGLGSAFAEISELARGCRFGNCRHEGEPGCRVLAAVETGELDPDRLERLRKLEKEEAFLARRKDKALQSEQRKKWKSITKSVRYHNRVRGRE